MGKRRRKNRTHLKGPQPGEEADKVPKSFVIKSGNVTKSVGALVRDVRKVMEPNTATRLKERPGARLRDYLTIAPTLGVTHLMAFTLTDAANVHLRVARLPQGPTLTFRVLRYSLMKDIVNAAHVMRNLGGKSPGGEYRNPPLLVLNGFQQPADGQPMPQLKLMSTMFQGLFPPIQVEKSALPTFRRVLLISYNHSTGPDLHAPLHDHASTDGYDSMSESEASEAESDTNAVELPEDYVGRGNKKGERKAVRLVETGPRLELKLVKIVEGLVGSKRGEGQTVYHAIETRTKEQESKLQRAHDERKKLKEKRKAEQAANVARKKAEKAARKGGKAEEDEEDDESEPDVDGLSDYGSDEDPEAALQRRRARFAEEKDEEDDDEFDYEDRAADEDEDLDNWDEDVAAGDVSDEEESDDESEDEAPPPKKRAGKR
ncbi:rRNA binding protein [Trichosporon asahii var. asahii CBS 2479]|uniref:rRNA binding protein n=1 Tax=Trichosporon asahii var. asahii (strain ATCC 90039 / CBS 2479 / JCM 2466 / KCTC 7840 / NBRC 103889/ NCYC 2677 / UAMH 7654) TaxID=1186058 RepID=J5SPK0_TRIAS|nr:rRNA binding protein [Trichosporon asahii var. asahii CBS 2479]EJT46811.1 rRNA binding protein [Trichosporon asahii var. asahii CBS 2479]